MTQDVAQRGTPWVKICGNTRLEDCLHAAACGADAVGFIFAPGRRTVTAEQIAPLTKQVPEGLEKIGIFTIADPEVIVDIAQRVGLTGVQLHAAYSPAFVEAVSAQAELAGLALMVTQVLLWDVMREANEQGDSVYNLCEKIERDGMVTRILIDSQTPKGSGGLGMRFDWQEAAAALNGTALPLIVAGGLRPDNVAEAVRMLQPFGVDVSSGVESLPGIKDDRAIEAFIRSVREAGSEQTGAGV